MQAVIYQLTLVMGLGTLIVLLLRGYSLQASIIRSGLVLVAVLILMIVAANILRVSMRTRNLESLSEELSTAPLVGEENEDDEASST
ncbi:MAG: hypothetical protein IH971_00520 [Candidatus Marinimicrobia bacterium]|nr:hypothetical protein [Candidatus Neomarinimicrobiota bacterium]